MRHIHQVRNELLIILDFGCNKLTLKNLDMLFGYHVLAELIKTEKIMFEEVEVNILEVAIQLNQPVLLVVLPLFKRGCNLDSVEEGFGLLVVAYL